MGTVDTERWRRGRVFALVLERFDSLAIKCILDCGANRFQGASAPAAWSGSSAGWA